VTSIGDSLPVTNVGDSITSAADSVPMRMSATP
jgi:hypothetical protein